MISESLKDVIVQEKGGVVIKERVVWYYDTGGNKNAFGSVFEVFEVESDNDESVYFNNSFNAYRYRERLLEERGYVDPPCLSCQHSKVKHGRLSDDCCIYSGNERMQCAAYKTWAEEA